MYGIRPATFGGKYQVWLDSLHPEDRYAAAELVRRAIVDRTQWLHEFRINGHGGSIRWIAGCGRCFYDSAASPINMIGINLDVTERVATEAGSSHQRSYLLRDDWRLPLPTKSIIPSKPLETEMNLVFLAKTREPSETSQLLEAADQELLRITPGRPSVSIVNLQRQNNLMS